MNVVSTSPSSTEILYALGVEPVAVSHACDYPPAARDRPTVDVSKVDAASSGDRHDQVQAATRNGHLYRMDAATLDAVEPDLVVTQGVCGVCAVDDVLVDETLAGLDADPDVLSLQASRLTDVFDCIRQVGHAVDRQDRAESLVTDLQNRLAAIERQVADEPRPRTLVLEWMDPIHPGASWVPDVVDAAGGEYGLVEPGARSQPVEWDAIRAYDPDVLVVAPCGFDADRTLGRLDELRGHPGWAELSAVQNDRVFVLDGSAYLTRWTPRLVDAAERLAAVLHPAVVGDPPADVVRVTG